MDERTKRAKAIQESIRQVLLNQWDPIGVNDIPEAQDEYDGYVGGVYRLLASGASEEEIVQHLFRIEVETMGLGPVRPNSDYSRKVAQTLLRLKVALNEE